MSQHSFELLREEPIEALNLTVEEYRHASTGARHLHLRSADRNNAFLVAFLTVPQDSTGVAHILEHTSLCGSEHFPVRDPFFMMIRRSLNTFMNAFTSSDWTAYPFASQNRKDFDNLLRVYLDAVFFPRLDELDFAQEGHRLEFATPDQPDTELVYRGVVFNEMKGAMSSPVSQLWHGLQKEVFPSITYHHNSGGDPEHIPDLSYADLKAFHATHYHPSNGVFLTYGDIPAAQHQAVFQELALARFQSRDLHLAVPDERRYTQPRRVELPYAVDAESDLTGNTHIVLGWLLGHTTELDSLMEATLLSGVLLDHSASPLRMALETSDLGSAPSELCGLDDSSREALFCCGLEGSESGRADEIEQLVMNCLTDVAENGVPHAQLESVLHQLELGQREIRGGQMPYGLRLMLNALPTALHGGDAVAVLSIDRVLDGLRESIRDPAYIKGLCRRLLLENSHRVRLVMAPDMEVGPQREQREQERLARIRAALTEQESQAIVDQAARLAERQAQEDDPEILPKVGLGDVPKDFPLAEGEALDVAGMPAAFYAQGTNGMVYQYLVVELPPLEAPLMEVLPLYSYCLSELGYGDLGYLQAQAHQAAVTGGISAELSMRGGLDDVQQTRAWFVLSGKALARNQDALAEIIHQVFLSPRFDEPERLRELIAQLRAQREMSVTDQGHGLAMAAAVAGMNAAGYWNERWHGLSGLRSLKALDDRLDEAEALEELGQRFARISQALRASHRRVLLVAEAAQRDAMVKGVEALWSDVANTPAGTALLAEQHTNEPVAQGWTTNTRVNFCCRAFGAVAAGHADAPALMVLGNLLNNGYLHRVVREQGGAYGSGASYSADTASFRFYSYRDPRISGTLKDFDAAREWLASTELEYRQVEEAILGVVAAIDRPDSPAGEAASVFFGELHGRTRQQRTDFRNRILAVNAADLLKVARRYLADTGPSTVVLGSTATLDEDPVEGLQRQVL